MRPVLLALLLLLLLVSAPTPADANEPLVCVDIGAIEIEDVITIDPPEVCIL